MRYIVDCRARRRASCADGVAVSACVTVCSAPDRWKRQVSLLSLLCAVVVMGYGTCIYSSILSTGWRLISKLARPADNLSSASIAWVGGARQPENSFLVLNGHHIRWMEWDGTGQDRTELSRVWHDMEQNSMYSNRWTIAVQAGMDAIFGKGNHQARLTKQPQREHSTCLLSAKSKGRI